MNKIIRLVALATVVGAAVLSYSLPQATNNVASSHLWPGPIPSGSGYGK
uniref:Uncharacterized protein n=1 Tax=mine drainage metagenome TaxID=410659 RepID=E6PYC0_9ZZZZ